MCRIRDRHPRRVRAESLDDRQALSQPRHAFLRAGLTSPGPVLDWRQGVGLCIDRAFDGCHIVLYRINVDIRTQPGGLSTARVAAMTLDRTFDGCHIVPYRTIFDIRTPPEGLSTAVSPRSPAICIWQTPATESAT